MDSPAMNIEPLRQGYLTRRWKPREFFRALRLRMEREETRDSGVWLHLLDEQELNRFLEPLRERSPEELPLYGIPFAIKDNIDLAGIPTSAGCPAYSYTPEESAPAVARLIEAGAVPVGKTNLDQFATGLVGTRSPGQFPRNPFHRDYIAGGSSSGSAVALARGWVSFSLGTDTAGSGRVPAAFNNIVGLKPTRGLISTRGVVPACRTLDCVSIFSLCCADARKVLRVMAAHDPMDPYSRKKDVLSQNSGEALPGGKLFRFAVPGQHQLEFFGNGESRRLFQEAVGRFEELGGVRVEIDFEPFMKTARLLYEGPWLAERYAAIREFIVRDPESLLPVTREIIEGGVKPSAVETFLAMYELARLRRQCELIWEQAEALLIPTAGTIYRVEEVEKDPIRLNTNLGYYTNFMNLLDLAAVAVPAGFTAEGLPFGVTLAAPAGREAWLLAWADKFHRSQDIELGLNLGRSGAVEQAEAEPGPDGARIRLAVCGAHMRGMPLNGQLRELGAVFAEETRTAPAYRLFALPGSKPPKPGLVRDESGASIALEIWELAPEQFGIFVASIPRPMCIGKVEILDGSMVSGFLCEPSAVRGARDITHLGGWRAYAGD